MFGYFPLRSKPDTPSDEGDCESLIPEGEKIDPSSQQPSHAKAQIIRILILIIAFPVTAFLGAYFGRTLFIEDRNCLAKVSKYSPLLEDIEIKFDTVHFNGSLFKSNKFRAVGNPEVDAAWESLGVDYRAAIVPVSLAAKSGLLDSQVQVREKYGGGFPANVEGLHHLHCLNLLRQSLYYNYEHYHSLGKGAFKNEDGVLQAHVSHCLDILRQQLMCTVDIAVLGQVWWNHQEPTAYPDFNTKHTCRNFDAVRKWAFEHQAPENVPQDYLKPPSMGDVLESLP